MCGEYLPTETLHNSSATCTRRPQIIPVATWEGLTQLFHVTNGFLKATCDTNQTVFSIQQSECIQFFADGIECPMSIFWFFATSDNNFPRPEQEQDDTVVFESVD
jgi:hypothetical protein